MLLLFVHAASAQISLPVRELGGDLGAVREFAQTADDLGFAHLRVPDQVIRPKSGPLHEPLTLLSWVAGFTRRPSPSAASSGSGLAKRSMDRAVE